MPWPQYQRFRQLAKEYQAKSGENQGAISKKMGINLFTYRNYLYGSKKPGIKTLKAAAKLFGCSIVEFVDNPGEPPEGLEKRAWSEASEQDRALCAAFLEDIKSLPEAEKEACYELWKQGVFKALAKQGLRD